MAVDLFGERRRRSPRVMMQMADAGQFPDGKSAGVFGCKRCGQETGWVYASITELRRGIPCQTCNGGEG